MSCFVHIFSSTFFYAARKIQIGRKYIIIVYICEFLVELSPKRVHFVFMCKSALTNIHNVILNVRVVCLCARNICTVNINYGNFFFLHKWRRFKVVTYYELVLWSGRVIKTYWNTFSVIFVNLQSIDALNVK